MTVMTNFKGIIPAIAVPFRRDHSIDEAELARFATWLARRKGIVGLMTNGHTGEVFSLTAKERAVKLAEVDCEIAKQDREEIALLWQLEDAGLSAPWRGDLNPTLVLGLTD